MTALQSLVYGQWRAGDESGEALRDPVRGTVLGLASTSGIDLGRALQHGRSQGSPALQHLTFTQRAGLLNAIAGVLSANRDEYYDIALRNSGSPKSDAAIDIDGSIFTLKYFARLGAGLQDTTRLFEGAQEPLSRDGAFASQHVLTPLRGVAVFINAFNFPAWGMWEKVAPALLSGAAVLVKPATSTALLTERMVRHVHEAGILPDGALSLLCGSARDLLEHVTSDDLIAFTGSADTARHIRSHVTVLAHGPRVNVEADSLNNAILGPDAAPGSAAFDLFTREIVREMSVKAGQKCTAIRRALLPRSLLDAVADAVVAQLARIVMGDPRQDDVVMGPVVNKAQQASVNRGIALLREQARVLHGGDVAFSPAGIEAETAAFVQPTLLACDSPRDASAVHEVEVFGPVATLLPYSDESDAFDLARRSRGALVASVFSGDDAFNERALWALASSHGRVHCVNDAVAGSQTGHGNVMPMSLHGGPGRAGGGEELGGLRALSLYHRRAAIQASATRLAALRAAGRQFQI